MLERKLVGDRVITLRLSMSQVAAYSGIGVNRLSPWLSGQKELPNAAVKEIYQTLVALEALQVAVGEEFPLDFRQVQKIKSLLERAKLDEQRGHLFAAGIF